MLLLVLREMGVLGEVAGDHLRLLLVLLMMVVEDLLVLLGLMIGGSGKASLRGCLDSQRSRAALHTQLTHPMDQAAMVTSASITSILSWLNAATLQSPTVLQLPAEFLPVRAEVEEVVALLQCQSLLLGQS